MSTNFASLGISVESSQAVKAADDLDKLVDAAEGAEKAVDDLGKAGEDLANTSKKISRAEAEAAQGIDKAAGATERQAEARRKSGASAVSEINIIRDLNNAMEHSGDSYASLAVAGDLLNKARAKGLVTAERELEFESKIIASHDRLEKAEAKETAQKQKLIDAESRRIEALKRTVNGIDPLVAKLAKVEAQEKALNDLHKAGGIDAEAYAQRLAKIGKDRDGLTATATAFDKLKLGTRQAQENVMQLTNALQSGDWASGARAVAQLGVGAGASASSLAKTAIPAAALTAVIGGLAYAYYDAEKQIAAFNRAIFSGTNQAGQTAASLSKIASAAALATGNISSTRDAVVALSSGAAGSGVQIQNLAEASAALSEISGKGADEIAASLANTGKTATDTAAQVSAQYGLLTYEQYQTIKAIDDQGEHQKALDLLSEDLNRSAQERLKRYRESLSDVERDWNSIKRAISNAYSAVRSELFPDAAKEVEVAKRILDTRKEGGFTGALSNLFSFGDNSTQALKKRVADAAARTEADEKETEAKTDLENANRDLIRVSRDLEGQLTNVSPESRKAEAYKKLKEQFLELMSASARSGKENPLLAGVDYNGKDFSGGAYDTLKKGLDEKLKTPKVPSGTVDLTAFNTSKNNLTGILSEYKNAQKELDAAQKAGLVSQADYLLKREAMIGNERDEVTAAYEAEIAALEAAKGKASTSAAQRIQLDQKIADARAAMVKAQRDADTELSVLAKNEEGRLKKQELAVKTYTSALQQQVDTLREQGMRAAAGLGQGDRQRDLTNQQNAIDDRINQQKLDLANQYGDGSRGMSLDEYTQKLQALEATQQQLRDTTVSNYADMTAAQGDWSNGASAAWQNYYDDATNFSSQTQMAFTNAFSGMNDALYDFVTTGKLSFDDMAATFASTALRMLIQWGTAQVAMAALNAFTSTAAIPLVGPFAAPAAAATALGQTGSFMATISSVAGMAHDGIDSIPKEGTWLLDKGERVVDSRTNADLKRYLAAEPSQSRSQDRKSGDINIPIQVTVQGQPGMSETEARRQGQLAGEGVRDIVRQVIQQEQRPGGMLA